MKLYGSSTSPYVRRTRIVLADKPYEFASVNIFGQDRAKIKAVNPTLRVPMFEDLSNADVPILLDSNDIYSYLSEKYQWPSLSWEERNLITHINSCTESLVNMMIMRRSELDTDQDKLYFNIQRERQAAVFSFLEQQITLGKFDSWHYPSVCLLTLVEWAMFRNLFDFSPFPELLKWLQAQQNQQGVQETKPKE